MVGLMGWTSGQAVSQRAVVTHPRLYVPKITSLAETWIIVTLLWCSGLLRFALGYLVGLWHCDRRSGRKSSVRPRTHSRCDAALAGHRESRE